MSFLSYRKPSLVTWMARLHWVATALPGVWGEWSPPAVQSFWAAAFCSTQVRLRSAPHSFAAVASSRNAERPCMPRNAVRPLGLNRFISSR